MYLALYRKYRPRTFDDVISQEHITNTLKNQIINGSAAHAYLFTGSRGTGKTTCAKILSMAVNCEHPENGNPCMKCDRCREILDGSAPDVVEMDAASNRGVDDVRRLRDEVSYTPVSCKYRVYIIDEVHMLTKEAFNALLKTLEEPPPHVKFILATTELHKVPATISSRCQRFEFHRIDVGDSSKRLMQIAEKEGFTLDEDAAALISRLSDGGMRDALSVLDRCVSCDSHVTSSVVRDCAGIADNHHLYEFSEMIAARNTAGCIRLLGDLHRQSKDIALIVNDLIEHFRDLMIYKSAPQESDLLFALPDELERVAAIAGMYSMGEVLSCLSLLSECSDNISRTRQRKTLAEICLVKMCARGGQAPTAQFSENIVQTAQMPAPAPMPAQPASVQPAPVQMPERPAPAPISQEAPPWEEPSFEEAPPMPPPQFEQEPPFTPPPEPPIQSEELSGDDYPIKMEAPSLQPAELKPFSPITNEQWNEAISSMEKSLFTSMLEGSKIKCADNTLIIITSNPMLLANVKGEELDGFTRKLSEKLGMRLHVKIESDSDASAREETPTPIEQLLKKAQQLGVKIKTID